MPLSHCQVGIRANKKKMKVKIILLTLTKMKMLRQYCSSIVAILPQYIFVAMQYCHNCGNNHTGSGNFYCNILLPQQPDFWQQFTATTCFGNKLLLKTMHMLSFADSFPVSCKFKIGGKVGSMLVMLFISLCCFWITFTP